MRCLILLLLLSLNGLVIADERFYTTVDAQGRIQVIKSTVDSKDEKKTTDTSSVVTTPAVVTAPEPSKSGSGNVEPVQTAKALQPQGTYQIGTETYIDSELLEKNDFGVGDKKRFYYLPDGSLGSQVVETKAGLIAAPKAQSVELAKPLSFVASAYQTLPSTELKGMYPSEQQCFSQKYLAKHAKPFKVSNDVWVTPSLTPGKFEADVIFNLSQLAVDVHSLRFASFASSHKKPKFYLPVLVFLDSNGCPLSGAWQYWSQAHAATDKLFASVDGLITIPEHSAYILSYRPVDTLKADIPSMRESGSFVIETY